MEIKDFICETLIQIDRALLDAHDKTGKSYWVSNGVKGSEGIKFNLAVTNSESNESDRGKKGGIKIKVIEANLESSGKTSAALETVSRIEFTIQVP